MSVKTDLQNQIAYCNTKLAEKGVTQTAIGVKGVGDLIESIRGKNIVKGITYLYGTFLNGGVEELDLDFENGVVSFNNNLPIFSSSNIKKLRIANVTFSSNASNTNGLFKDMPNLEELILENVDMSNGNRFGSGIRNTKISRFVAQQLPKGEFQYMTMECPNLKYVEGDFSRATDLGATFYAPIETIKYLDCSSCTGFSNTFTRCDTLKNITFAPECIKFSVSFANCALLTDDSIQSIVDGLAPVTTSQTITFHDTVRNKLTDKQKGDIWDKGWNIAGLTKPE